MGRPRRIDQEAIVAAARRVFLDAGPGATTRDIADAAGISQSLLFQRYRTKEALLQAAVVPRPPALATLLGDTPKPGSIATKRHLIGIADRLLAWIEAALPGALSAALDPRFPGTIAAVHGSGGHKKVAAAVARRLKQLQARGDVRREADTTCFATTLLVHLHGVAIVGMLAGAPPKSRNRNAAEAIASPWPAIAPGGKESRTPDIS